MSFFNKLVNNVTGNAQGPDYPAEIKKRDKLIRELKEQLRKSNEERDFASKNYEQVEKKLETLTFSQDRDQAFFTRSLNAYVAAVERVPDEILRGTVGQLIQRLSERIGEQLDGEQLLSMLEIDFGYKALFSEHLSQVMVSVRQQINSQERSKIQAEVLKQQLFLKGKQIEQLVDGYEQNSRMMEKQFGSRIKQKTEELQLVKDQKDSVIQELSETIKAKVGELEETKGNLVKLKNSQNGLKVQNQKLEKKLSQQCELTRELESKNNDLANNISQLKNLSSGIKQLENLNSNLRDQLSRLNKKNQDLKSSLLGLSQGKIMRLKEGNVALKGDLEALVVREKEYLIEIWKQGEQELQRLLLKARENERQRADSQGNIQNDVNQQGKTQEEKTTVISIDQSNPAIDRRELQNYERQIESLKSQIYQLIMKIEIYQHKLKEKQEEKLDLKTKTLAYEKEIEDKRILNEDVNSKLQLGADILKNKELQLEEIKKQLIRIEINNQQLRRENQRLQSERIEIQNMSGDLDRQIQESQNQLKQKDNQIAIYEKKIEDIQKSLEQRSQTVNKLEQSILEKVGLIDEIIKRQKILEQHNRNLEETKTTLLIAFTTKDEKIDEITKQIQQKDTYLGQISKSIQEKDKLLYEKDEAIKTINERINEANEKLERTTHEYEECLVRIKNIEQKLNTSNEQIIGLQSLNYNIAQERSALVEKITNLETSEANLTSTNNQLVNQISDLKRQMKDQVQKLENVVQQLRVTNQQKVFEISTLQERVVILSESLNGRQGESDNSIELINQLEQRYKGEIVQKNKTLQEQSRVIHGLKTERDILEESLKSKQIQNEQDRQKWLKEETKISGRLNELRGQLELSQSNLKEGEKRIQEFEEKIQIVNKAKEQLQMEKKELIYQLEKISHEKSDLEQLLKNSNNLLSTYEQQKNHLREEIRILGQQKEKWLKRVGQLEAERDKTSRQLQEHKIVLQDKNQQINNIFLEKQRLQGYNKQKQIELQRLRQQNTGKNAELQEIREQIAVNNVQLDRLKQQITVNSTKLQLIGGQIITKNTELGALREQIIVKNSQYQILRQEISVKNAELEGLKQQNTKKNSDLQLLREQIRAKDDELQKNKQHLNLIEMSGAEIQNLKAQNDSLARRKAQIQFQLSQISNQLNILNEASTTWKSQKQEFQKNIQRIQFLLQTQRGEKVKFVQDLRIAGDQKVSLEQQRRLIVDEKILVEQNLRLANDSLRELQRLLTEQKDKINELESKAQQSLNKIQQNERQIEHLRGCTENDKAKKEELAQLLNNVRKELEQKSAQNDLLRRSFDQKQLQYQASIQDIRFKTQQNESRVRNQNEEFNRQKEEQEIVIRTLQQEIQQVNDLMRQKQEKLVELQGLVKSEREAKEQALEDIELMSQLNKDFESKDRSLAEKEAEYKKIFINADYFRGVFNKTCQKVNIDLLKNEMEALRRDNQQVKRMLSHKQEDNNSIRFKLEQQLSESTKIADHFEVKYNEIKKQNQTLVIQLSLKSDKIASLEIQVKEKQIQGLNILNRLQQFQQKSKIQIQEYKTKSSKKESEISKLAQKNSQLQGKLAHYKGAVEEKNQLEKNHEENVVKLKKQIDALKVKNTELAIHAVQQKDNYQKQLNKIRSQIQKVSIESAALLRKELANKDEAIRLQKQGIDQRLQGQIRKYKQLLQNSKKEKEQLEKEIVSIRVQLLQQKKISARANAKLNEISSDMSKYDNLQNYTNDLNQKMMLKDEEIKKIFANMQTLKGTMSDLEEGIQTYQQMAQEKERQAAYIRQELEKSQNQNALLKQEIEKLERKARNNARYELKIQKQDQSVLAPERTKKESILPLKMLFLKYFEPSTNYEGKIRTFNTLCEALSLDSRELEMMNHYKRTKLIMESGNLDRDRRDKQETLGNKFLQFLNSD